MPRECGREVLNRCFQDNEAVHLWRLTVEESGYYIRGSFVRGMYERGPIGDCKLQLP